MNKLDVVNAELGRLHHERTLILEYFLFNDTYDEDNVTGKAQGIGAALEAIESDMDALYEILDSGGLE